MLYWSPQLSLSVTKFEDAWEAPSHEGAGTLHSQHSPLFLALSSDRITTEFLMRKA